MKLPGFVLLVSGALIAFAAVALLGAGGARFAFLLAGVALQAGGLAMVARAHLPAGGRDR